MSTEKKGGVADRVREMALPLIESLGLTLWDVRFLKEGADWILRITIDKEDGVSIDDCVAVNDILDQPLDELDPVGRPYRLQVQSPGAERELTRDEHFMRFIGSDITLKLHKALAERKEYAGTLTAYGDGKLSVLLADGTSLELAKDDVAWVRLDDMKNFI